MFLYDVDTRFVDFQEVSWLVWGWKYDRLDETKQNFILVQTQSRSNWFGVVVPRPNRPLSHSRVFVVVDKTASKANTGRTTYFCVGTTTGALHRMSIHNSLVVVMVARCPLSICDGWWLEARHPRRLTRSMFFIKHSSIPVFQIFGQAKRPCGNPTFS